MLKKEEIRFAIEEILKSSISLEEKARLISEHIRSTAEEEDECLSVEIIKKAFPQLRNNTIRGFRGAVLLVVVEDKNINIFAVNRNLLRIDCEVNNNQATPDMIDIFKKKFKLPTLQ